MSLYEMYSDKDNPFGNSLLNWGGNSADEILTYAWNYRAAAMNLVAFREQQKIYSLDHGALPILFLYRHSFELYLKAIIYKAAAISINKEEISKAIPKLWREHSLVRLVEICGPVLKPSNPHPLTRDGELEKDVMGLAKEIDKIDPGSFAFRYPVTSKGQASLPSHFFTNIFRLSDAMEKVFDDLAQFCGCVEGRQQAACDQLKLNLLEVS